MVRQIKRLFLFFIIVLLLTTNIFAVSDDYTSPYYSDTSNLEEAKIIDKLYEYGLMNGILLPKDGKQGVFAPQDEVSYQEFYIIINNLMETSFDYSEKTGIIPHYVVRIIFTKALIEKQQPIILNNYELPEKDNKSLTRIELARLIYSYADQNNLIPINERIVEYALTFLGSKYIHGGNSPKGFDCSGFTQYIMKYFGIKIGRTCNAQYNNGEHITFKNLLPGDLVLFERTYVNRGCSHVGIYIGDNKFIHACNPKSGVIISSLNEEYYASRFMCGQRVWD